VYKLQRLFDIECDGGVIKYAKLVTVALPWHSFGGTDENHVVSNEDRCS
jgi:hypothetical protein